MVFQRRRLSTMEQRRSQLAAIHAAKRELRLDDDTYRAVVERVSAEVGEAKRSSGDLDDTQRIALIEELRKLGAGRRAGHGRAFRTQQGRPGNADSAAMPETVRKIEAQLADLRAPWSYADAIASRMFGIARVAWVRRDDQLAAIVAALHVEQEKHALNEGIDAYLKHLAWEPERVVQLLGPLRPNWRRHRASLRLVAAFLTARITDSTRAAPTETEAVV